MEHARIFALDLALLLPPHLAAEARRINRILVHRSGDASISLGERGCLPHVTLAMAPVPEDRVEAAAAMLKTVFEQHAPLDLTLTGISTVVTGAGRPVSGFDLARTDALAALHRDVTGGLAAFAADADPLLAVGSEETPEATMISYVRTFSRASAYARYSPHVTLGVGEAGDGDASFAFPFGFQGRAAAVCRVGNGGTCRQVLAEIQI